MSASALVLSVGARSRSDSFGPGLDFGESAPDALRDGADSCSCSCRFCGGDAACWQERLARGGDEDAKSSARQTPVCALCDLAQRLDDPEIDREGALIWLPELTQAELNILVRRVHLTLFQHDVPLPPGRVAPPAAAPWRAASIAFAALKERENAALRRLGTNSPRELGDVLLRMSPGSYRRRAELMAGTRLLPLGSLFNEGRDIYPDLLEEWTRKSGAPKNNQKQDRSC